MYLNGKLSNDEKIQIVSKKSEEFIMIKLKSLRMVIPEKLRVWLKNAGSYTSQEA